MWVRSAGCGAGSVVVAAYGQAGTAASLGRSGGVKGTYAASGGAASDFAASAPLESGGRIGGKGAAGEGDGAGGGDALAEIFSLADLDQKPHPLFQAPPAYPAEMRQRKTQGQVTVLFVVDAMGRVQLPKIEASSHPAFEKPALDAIRQWRFEPGMRGGQKVQSRMRVPIRFAFS